jgi:starvation-inducible outer membrane lipoprotein
MRLGGEILSLTFPEGKSLLTIRHRELDTRGQPSGAASGYTFLAESQRFLSPSHYLVGRQVTVQGPVAGSRDGQLLLQARELKLGDYPRWEKYYYPVPREWYDGDPALEHWFTPPHFDPWYGGHGR